MWSEPARTRTQGRWVAAVVTAQPGRVDWTDQARDGIVVNGEPAIYSKRTTARHVETQRRRRRRSRDDRQRVPQPLVVMAAALGASPTIICS